MSLLPDQPNPATTVFDESARSPSPRRLHLERATKAVLAAGLTVVPMAAPLRAQPRSWPNRPIRMVIPFPAGGATDIVGRVIAQHLSGPLGQQVVVDNKPGAGGTIGADVAAKAAPDGYTLLMATSSTHSIGPLLNPKIPYDAFKDFSPIICIADAPSVLVVGRDSPARTALELIDMLKKNPGKYNFGSSGIGTYPHLSAEMFKWRAGNLFAVHIPYRGTGLVIADLVSGQIAFLMDSVISAQPHIRDGKVRPLAVSGSRRIASLPDVPTFAELKISGMDFTNWFGIFGPAKLPADIVQRVNQTTNEAIRTADVRTRFAQVGAEPRGGTPADFDRIYRQEAQTWKAVIERAKITVS